MQCNVVFCYAAAWQNRTASRSSCILSPCCVRVCVCVFEVTTERQRFSCASAHVMLPDGRQLRQLRALYALSTLPATLQRLSSPPFALASLSVSFLLVAVHTVRYLPATALGQVGKWCSLGALALDPVAVVQRRELWRLLSSAAVHVDLAHLLLNVSSLLVVGPPLERALGTPIFTGLLVFFACASSVLYCVATGILSLCGRPLSRSAAGFSCVLFALIPLTAKNTGTVRVGGIRIPAQYRDWAELVRTQILLPEASLLGHVCGLVSGYSFIALRTSLRRITGTRLHTE